MIARFSGTLYALSRTPFVILVLLALGGILLSGYAGWREASQHQAIEQLRLSEAVDSHFIAVQDHMIAREKIAETVATLFEPPPLPNARPFGDYGKQVVNLIPDIATVSWMPEVPPEKADQALASLAASGVENPRLIGANGQTLIPETMTRPLYPIVDIAPERNRWTLGLDAGSFPDRFAAIQQARERRKVVRTTSVQLVQSPDIESILLYAPVFASDGTFLGVMGFGYKADQLFRAALTVGGWSRDFSVLVYTENSDVPLFGLEPSSDSGFDTATPGAAKAEVSRSMEFAGRQLRFVYTLPRDLAREGFWRGLWVAMIGITLTLATVSLLGLIANRATTLAHEVESRRSAEDRLKVLIHELNHRVRNVMAVAQAVVRLSFTSGSNLAEIQKTCEGRLQALANTMSLLTASDWKNVSFRSLINEEVTPYAGRIKASGPDIAIRGRSAQTFALLIHELATNAAKHGAFTVPDGKAELQWAIGGPADAQTFRMTWRETGGPAVKAPSHRGFGELLLRRIAPRDVAGRGTTKYTESGFEYAIEAPLAELTGNGSNGKM